MRLGLVVSLLILSMGQAIALDNAAQIKLEKMQFGFFPYISGSRLIKLYKPLMLHLAKELNRDVIIVSSKTFRQFVERTEQQQYDIIFTAPHFAFLAEKHNIYERLYRFKNNTAGYFFVSAKSNIETVQNLRNKVIAMPDHLAIISTLSEVYLESQNFNIDKDIKFLHTPSHNNTILAVMNHKADAGVVARPVYDMFDKKRPGELRLLAKTQQVPGAMFMLKAALPEDEKAKIRQAFASFPESDRGREFFRNTPFSGLEKVSDDEMRSLIGYVKVLEKHLAEGEMSTHEHVHSSVGRD